MSLLLPAGEPATYTARALWESTAGEPEGEDAFFWIDTVVSVVPAGMTVTEESLTGTPTTAGDYTIVVLEQYRDEMGDYLERSHTVVVTVDGGEDPEPPAPDDPAVVGVVSFMGQADNPDLLALAKEHLPIIRAMVKAYTRGGGFTEAGPNEDVAAVITTATARLLANPEQLRYQAGSIQINDSFRGWTLAETFVLNRYRRRSH